MRKLLSFACCLLALASQGQTVNQLEAAAAPFQRLGDRELQIIDAYMLAAIAGASLNPNTLLVSAAQFQAVSDRDLQIIQTYLLSNIGQSPSIADAMANTRVGTTRGQNYKENIPTNLLYIASGEGIVRSIEYTSEAGITTEFDARTNRSIRIYCDAGAINFGAAALSLPAANLVAEIPLYNIMDCKYWSIFRTNYDNPQAFGTRYVGWVEVPALSAYVGGNAHYTVTLRYPIPFTNGVAIVLWDKGINNYTNSGFSFVNYELTSTGLPNNIRNYRLRTFHTLTNNSTAPIILNYTGAGEVVSLFTSSTNDPLDADAYWEGVWRQNPDGLAPAGEAFGCAGGEDMFNNGYFFDGGALCTFDWGCRYIHKDLSGITEAYYNENYRHFYGADSHRWQSNNIISFNIGAPVGEWDSLCIFYGK